MIGGKSTHKSMIYGDGVEFTLNMDPAIFFLISPFKKKKAAPIGLI